MSKTIRAAIRATGSCVPQKVLTNEDLEALVETSDEWIFQRTGIKQRRILDENEGTAQLAIQAAKNALQSSSLSADQLDLIVCATVTPEIPFPATACFVQDALEIGDIPVFDISAACSGYIYALSVAEQFIRTGTYQRVMVIGVDALSRITDYTDRGSCILFGDAAGAAILEATDDGTGVIYSTLHAKGAGWDYIHVPGGGARKPVSKETLEAGDHFIKMRGRDVYKFAVEKMQWILGDCLSACDLSVEDIDLLIPHQVNARIIDSAAKKYKFPMDKVYVNIDRFGNTSSASIPLAMDEAIRAGRIGPGATVLLAAFGAGLTWAGAVVKL